MFRFFFLPFTSLFAVSSSAQLKLEYLCLRELFETSGMTLSSILPLINPIVNGAHAMRPTPILLYNSGMYNSVFSLLENDSDKSDSLVRTVPKKKFSFFSPHSSSPAKHVIFRLFANRCHAIKRSTIRISFHNFNR